MGGHALPAFHGIEGEPDLLRAGSDGACKFAGAEPDRLQFVESDESGCRVYGVHHVVERRGELMDVFTINRCHKRAIQPLNDFVSQEIAFVLDFHDLVSFAPDGFFRCEHFFQQNRAFVQFIGQCLKIGVELLFAGYQAECQSNLPLTTGCSFFMERWNCSRSISGAITL